MALIDIDKEPVAFARRGVVEKPLALRGVLRDEPTLETHPLLGIGRRRERLHPLPRLRRTGVVRLSAEGEFDVLELSDKTIFARGVNAKRHRQLRIHRNPAKRGRRNADYES